MSKRKERRKQRMIETMRPGKLIGNEASKNERHEKQIERLILLKEGTVKPIPIDRTKIISQGMFLLPSMPARAGKYYYRDYPFTCCDCGSQEIWTGSQQKWWYEVKQGIAESVAIRCRSCRAKERARKAEVNRLREEGLARKKRESKA